MASERRCRVCGVDLHPLPYICSYCGGVHCIEHNLPEKHGCEKLAEAGKVTSAPSLEGLSAEVTEFEAAYRRRLDEERNPLKKLKRKLGLGSN